MRVALVYHFSVFVLLTIVAAGCTLKSNEEEGRELNKLFEAYYEERLELFPTEATSIGDYRYDDRFENSISEEHRAKQKKLYKKYISLVKETNYDNLSYQDKLSYDVFLYDIGIKLESLNYPEHLLPINHMFSVPIGFVQYASGTGDHKFETVKNYDDFLKRIDGFVDWVNTAIENMNKGI